MSSMDESIQMDDTANQFLDLFTRNLPYGYTCIGQKALIEVCSIEKRNCLAEGKPCTELKDVWDWRYLALQKKELFSFDYLEEDSYGTYTNVFFSPIIYNCIHRSGDNALFFSSVYVDLDHCTYEEALLRLKKLPEELQQPTIIVNSGNGSHIYWILSFKPKVSRHKELWQRTLKELRFRLNGDAKVTGLAQLLRLPGTWNEKDGIRKACTLIDCTSEKQFNLYDIAHLLGTYSTKSEKKKIGKSERTYKKKNPPKNRQSGYQNLLIKEIIKLMKHRAKNGDDVGYRTTSLYALKQLDCSATDLEKINQELFSKPLSQSEVDHITKLEYLNKPVRATLVEKLEVCIEEQKYFRYLVNEELYLVRQNLRLLHERKLPSLTNRLRIFIQRKYAKRKQPLNDTVLELRISDKTVRKYKKNRTMQTELLSFRNTLEEANQVTNNIVDSESFLQTVGWTAYDTNCLEQLQEYIYKLNDCYEVTEKIIIKKQVTTNDHHKLLQTIQILDTLKKQIETDRLFLKGGK